MPMQISISNSIGGGGGNLGSGGGSSFTNTKSIALDGVDDYVEIGNPSNLQLTGAMTLSFWFKGQPSQSGHYAGFDKLGGGGQRGAGLDLRKGTGIYLYIASATSTNLLVSTNTSDTTPLTDGNWHHVMGVFIPSTSLKIYLDGNVKMYGEYDSLFCNELILYDQDLKKEKLHVFGILVP